VLQIGKEQEDSAILLASNRPQQKDKMKNQTNRNENAELQRKGEQGTNKE
jgi:hypothetical protein